MLIVIVMATAMVTGVVTAIVGLVGPIRPRRGSMKYDTLRFGFFQLKFSTLSPDWTFICFHGRPRVTPLKDLVGNPTEASVYQPYSQPVEYYCEVWAFKPEALMRFRDWSLGFTGIRD